MTTANALQGIRRDVAGALTRAGVLRALARGLDDPAGAWRAEVADGWRALLRGTGEWPDEVRAALARALTSLEVATDDLASEHVRLFGPAGRAALTETSWGDAGRLLGKATALADLGGFYRAFGVQPDAASPRPEDHLALELEFVSVLALKEAWARSGGETEALAVTRDATAKFLADHLGTWIDAWCTALAEQGAPDFYVALGEAVRCAVRAECERLAVIPHTVAARLPEGDLGGEAFTCPRADAADATV
ncbi:MAG: molecular chaperone TorD family protein [Deltaproteobacteria bacterium]|nr:molecular chaperone TorD family protein [Deltaproteobacteria bacterium]